MAVTAGQRRTFLGTKMLSPAALVAFEWLEEGPGSVCMLLSSAVSQGQHSLFGQKRRVMEIASKLLFGGGFELFRDPPRGKSQQQLQLSCASMNWSGCWRSFSAGSAPSVYLQCWDRALAGFASPFLHPPTAVEPCQGSGVPPLESSL